MKMTNLMRLTGSQKIVRPSVFPYLHMRTESVYLTGQSPTKTAPATVCSSTLQRPMETWLYGRFKRKQYHDRFQSKQRFRISQNLIGLGKNRKAPQPCVKIVSGYMAVVLWLSQTFWKECLCYKSFKHQSRCHLLQSTVCRGICSIYMCTKWNIY